MFEILRPKIEMMFTEGECFPECHASSLTRLSDGAILAVYFAGAHEKADDVGIWLSKRTADGWQKPRLLAKIAPVPHWNPVIYAYPGGLRVNFKVGSEIKDWTTYKTESYDGGETWTRPVPLGSACGPVRSKPVLLSNGALLAPNSVETDTTWRPRVDFSDDYGSTFPRSSAIPINNSAADEADYISGKGAIQPTLWESKAGHVHALLRTTCGYVFRADSADCGNTFSRARNTGIPNNNSGIDLVKTPDALYLAMNPVSGNWAARTPLMILKSTDNGESFSDFACLADLKTDEKRRASAEFSYPALIFDGKSLHASFTWMRRCIAYARIDL